MVDAKTVYDGPIMVDKEVQACDSQFSDDDGIQIEQQ